MRHRPSNRIVTDTQPQAVWPWARNWIDFRHSLVMADKRGDHHDTHLTICADCGCETDLTPQPHSPKCDVPA